jgi:hypothetical protein
MQRWWCKTYTASSSQLVWTKICSTTGAHHLKYSFDIHLLPLSTHSKTVFLTVCDEPQNEVFIVFPSIVILTLPLQASTTTSSKKWIKNCCIHMKIFFVCKHFTYVSVTNRNFFLLWALSREETWICFFPPFTLHLFDMNSKNIRNELLIQNHCSFLSPFGPVNFMIKKAVDREELHCWESTKMLFNGASSFSTCFWELGLGF